MGEEPPRPPAVDRSTVDDLIDRTKKFLSSLAADYVKRPVDELLRWVLSRATAYLLAAAFFCTAAVFLMIAGVEGLKRAQVPGYLAYLALGVVGLIAGLIALRQKSPKP